MGRREGSKRGLQSATLSSCGFSQRRSGINYKIVFFNPKLVSGRNLTVGEKIKVEIILENVRHTQLSKAQHDIQWFSNGGRVGDLLNLLHGMPTL